MLAVRALEVGWRKGAILDSNASALQTQLECLSDPSNPLAQEIELVQLLFDEGLPAGAERSVCPESVEQRLDLIERKAGLLCESQHVDAMNDGRVVLTAAADPGRRWQDSRLLVIPQSRGPD